MVRFHGPLLASGRTYFDHLGNGTLKARLRNCQPSEDPWSTPPFYECQSLGNQSVEKISQCENNLLSACQKTPKSFEKVAFESEDEEGSSITLLVSDFDIGSESVGI